MSPTTLGLLGTNRRSPRQLLFQWEGNDRSLTPRTTGGAGVLARASTAYVPDQNGIFASIANNAPRFGYVNGAFGLVLEQARTNVALWCRDFTNAAWVKTSITAALNQVGIDGTVNSASSLTATGAGGTALQSITHSSALTAVSVYVRRLVGSGAVSVTMDNVTFTPVTVTAAWTQVTIPTQTIANLTVGFKLATNGDAIAVDFCQAENGASPSSPMLTTSASFARSAETPSFACNDVGSAARTVYVRYVDQGSQLAAAGIMEVGQFGVNPSIVLYHAAATTVAAAFHDGAAQVNAGVFTSGIVVGDLVEWRVVLTASGTIAVNLSRNGAAEVAGGASAGEALASVPWGNSVININKYTTGNTGLLLLESVRIASGVQTLAQMQQLDLN